VATLDCANVVVGDHAGTQVKEIRHDVTAQLSLALIPGNRQLVRALARAVASPGDPAARSDLERAASAAASATPDQAILATTDIPVGSIDLSGGRLTVAGVTAALVGTDGKARRRTTLAIDEVAVTGAWPGGGPVEPVATHRWHDLYWYLLDPRRRLAP
jgi:hypothetical protein